MKHSQICHGCLSYCIVIINRVTVTCPLCCFPTRVKSCSYLKQQFSVLIFEDSTSFTFWVVTLIAIHLLIFTTEHVMSYLKQIYTCSWKTLIRAAIKDSKFTRLVECWKNPYTSNRPNDYHIWIIPLIYGDSITLIANLLINCNWDTGQPPSSFLSVVPGGLLRLRNIHIMSTF